MNKADDKQLENIEIAKTLDTTGLRCPLPVIKMEAALRLMSSGQHLKIIADDPIARIDIPHYATKAGHNVIELTEETGQNMSQNATNCVFIVTCCEK